MDTLIHFFKIIKKRIRIPLLKPKYPGLNKLKDFNFILKKVEIIFKIKSGFKISLIIVS